LQKPIAMAAEYFEDSQMPMTQEELMPVDFDDLLTFLMQEEPKEDDKPKWPADWGQCPKFSHGPQVEPQEEPMPKEQHEPEKEFNFNEDELIYMLSWSQPVEPVEPMTREATDDDAELDNFFDDDEEPFDDDEEQPMEQRGACTSDGRTCLSSGIRTLTSTLANDRPMTPSEIAKPLKPTWFEKRDTKKPISPTKKRLPSKESPTTASTKKARCSGTSWGSPASSSKQSREIQHRKPSTHKTWSSTQTLTESERSELIEDLRDVY